MCSHGNKKPLGYCGAGAGMGVASHGLTLVASRALVWSSSGWPFSFPGIIVLIPDSRMSPLSWWCLGSCQSENAIAHRAAGWATLPHALLTFVPEEHFLNCGPRSTLPGMLVCRPAEEFLAEFKFEKSCNIYSLFWGFYEDHSVH